MFDLLLRSRDHGMGEALAEMHRHQGDNLHRFAGAGRLFDQHGTAGSADIGDETGLVRTKRFAGCGIQGWFSGQAEAQEYLPATRRQPKARWIARVPRSAIKTSRKTVTYPWRCGGLAVW